MFAKTGLKGASRATAATREEVKMVAMGDGRKGVGEEGREQRPRLRSYRGTAPWHHPDRECIPFRESGIDDHRR